MYSSFGWPQATSSGQIDDGSGANQGEYVGLEPAQYGFGVGWCPLGTHSPVPIQCYIFECAAVDSSGGLGVALWLNGANAIRQLSFRLEPFRHQESKKFLNI
ncbi:Unknown protein sequence [Pseudomonas syringae pv. viburni]|uniref:Uncharacterized protein n=1 Tax=Pseudomonas syringae pv. viburni TaxID=251703 RepID=A0A0Q0JBT9_9PSED|nr:Unknown protein sequence [Pseudomonas syringae pv. viburni]